MPQFEPHHFEQPAKKTESRHECASVREAIERVLHGDGLAIVHPVGVDAAARQQAHDEIMLTERIVGNGDMTDSVEYYTEFDPVVLEPIFSKLLGEESGFSEPMFAVNLQYMVYPPGSKLASHYDFIDADTVYTSIYAGGLDEESISLVYVFAGTKQLGAEIESAGGTQEHVTVTQQPDMLLMFRGGAIQDGDTLRKAILHWVPELGSDEQAASLTFELMPKRNRVDEARPSDSE